MKGKESPGRDGDSGKIREEPSEAAVSFLVAEYSNQYEQYRHQDQLRISYLQIYFTLATVLFAGTGLAFQSASEEQLPLVVLLSLGYLFLFAVGQLAARMMIALRSVQVYTAVLLDQIRVYLGDAFGYKAALGYYGVPRTIDFYEPDSSSTWLFRFITVLNSLFLSIGIGLGGGVAVQALGGFEGLPWPIWAVSFACVAGACLAVIPRRELARLSRGLREVQASLQVEERYLALEALAPPGRARQSCSNEAQVPKI